MEKETGLSTEAINTKLKEQGMRAVMQAHNIDRQASRITVQAKVAERVKQATANGAITPEQEKDILEKMDTCIFPGMQPITALITKF